MSGHITTMSRGSSVGSSASRPSSTSRSTSICRAGPWQLCTCTERSPAAGVRPCGPDRVGGDVGLQPAQQRVRTGCARRGIRRSRARSAAPRCSSRRSRPRVASSGWRAACRPVSSRRGTGPWVPRAPATARHWDAAATGAGRGGRTARRGARSRCSPAGCGRTATAGPAGRSGPPAAGRRFSRAGCAGDRRGSVGTSARHSCGCQARSVSRSPSGVAREPVDQQLRTLPGVGGEQPGQPAGDRVAPAPAQFGLPSVVGNGPDALPVSRTTARRGCCR